MNRDDRRILAWLEGGEPVPGGDWPMQDRESAESHTDAARSTVRPLTDGERAAVMGVGAAVAGVALLGFANSFAAVMTAAWPSFGKLAPTVPLAVDLGILIFAALDLVLARLDMRLRWVRLVPWALTAATIWLNVAGQGTWFGRVAHGVLPGMWVLAVEAGAHVIRVRARLAGGKAMDRIRVSRWLLAPVRTAGLWRRMVLWEVRSYPLALARERARILARTGLQDAYGGLAWRWRAPRRARALYRLGELAPDALTAPPPPAEMPEQDAAGHAATLVPLPATTLAVVPGSAEDAAGMAYRASVAGGNPLSERALADRFGISRTRAARVRAEVARQSNGHETEN